MALPFGNKPWSQISDVEAEGDRICFTWKVGRVRTCSFGDNIPSTVVKAGGTLWKVVYFPKGFTDPDYASVYITNTNCEADEGDPDNPDAITKQAFATVSVTMTPAPEGLDAAGGGQAEGGEGEDEEGDEDAASAASSEAPPSTQPSKASGSRKSGSKKSGSKRAGSVRASQAGSAADGKGEVEEVKPIYRELSVLYTNKEPSWGFEKMFDIGLLYNWKKGYMRGFSKKEEIQNGYIEMKIEIFCVPNIKTDGPDPDLELTQEGRQRVYWTVKNFKRLVDKIGPKKKLSSDDFKAKGHWYLDLYPNGFQNGVDDEEGNISLYLHSTRRQVELQEVYKLRFKLGLKKQNPYEEEVNAPGYDSVWFPPKSSCVCVFDKNRKCFGKKNFVRIQTVAKGRTGVKCQGEDLEPNEKEFILGNWEGGGAAMFVLDILITDSETWGVQHMLHQIEEFGLKQLKCTETDLPFGPDWMGQGKVICYHCGKAFSKEVTNYQARMDEYGYEVGREYISDILMREEEHWLDGTLKKIDLLDKFDQGVKFLTEKVAGMRVRKDTDDPNPKQEEPLDEENDPKVKQAIAAEEAYQQQLKEYRLEVEDAHFSKPVCSKCAEKRKMLQASEVIFANEPTPRGMKYDCPDQNESEPSFADREDGIEAHQVDKQARNFRKDWRKHKNYVTDKFESMQKAMMSTTIKQEPAVYHAADEELFNHHIRKKLPVDKRGMDKERVAEMLGTRNAMTLVRGNTYVEPLEICRQCNGRVNEDGITPEEDEDAPRNTFCDVRFDVRKPPPAIYCLYTGKVYCSFCANPETYKVPLPMFEMDPTEAEPKQVCFAAKEWLGKLPAPRITPVSEKEEEEVVPKRRGAAEEEEEDEGDEEPAIIAMLRKIPFCGPQIADNIMPQE